MSPTARLRPLELGLRQARPAPWQRRASAIVAVVVVAVVAWLTVLLFVERFGELDAAKARELAGRAAEKLRHAPDGALLEITQFLLIVAAAFFSLWHARRSQKYERLFLDENGIRYQSPLPVRLRFLQPDWSLRWSDVRTACVVVPSGFMHPAAASLELDAGSAKRKVRHVVLWSEPGGPAPAQWRRTFFSGAGYEGDAARALEDSPLVRYARQAGVAVGIEAKGTSGFRLETHRQAMTATILVLLLLGYAVIDLAVNKESYLEEPALAVFVIGGAGVAFAGSLWLVSAGAPRVEAVLLSLLLGSAAAFALVPGLLRVNQLTDTEGLRSHEYRLTGYVTFSPIEPKLPELRLAKFEDYWAQFKIGTIHSFDLRKGALGFYQVDMEPVQARMREYYLGRH